MTSDDVLVHIKDRKIHDPLDAERPARSKRPDDGVVFDLFHLLDLVRGKSRDGQDDGLNILQGSLDIRRGLDVSRHKLHRLT